MYNLLTTPELTVLQSMLFEGTENTYTLACGGGPGQTECYRPVHRELGRLFLEVGAELLDRLDDRLDDRLKAS